MTSKKLDNPITVAEVALSDIPAHRANLLFGGKCGDFVSIRPCDPQYGEKTYLGVLLGEIARSVGFGFNAETQRLTFGFSQHNPAIFVPDLATVIYGSASWWGLIKSEDDLKQITDADIENVWYVRALKAIHEKEG